MTDEITAEEFAPTLESEHRELMLGAIEKAISVITLTHGFPIESVLEIGCGTGALLQRLEEAEFGLEYYAVEPSESRHEFLARSKNIHRLARSECSTFEASTLATRHYDLVILSHVLEHLEDPANLLAAALRVAEHVVVEVPLEGQAAVHARMRLRAYLRRVDITDNVVGHIQFFSRRDVEKLAGWCGAEVLNARTYVPRPQLQDIAQHESAARRLHARAVLGLAEIVGQDRWADIYYGHYAVLLRKRAPRPKSQRRSWMPSTYYGS